MGKEAVSLFGLEEEGTARVRAESVAPLPMRQCVLLIFFGSAVCYGLGFAVVTVFNHLLAVL
jgi:hypothetical protein